MSVHGSNGGFCHFGYVAWPGKVITCNVRQAKAWLNKSRVEEYNIIASESLMHLASIREWREGRETEGRERSRTRGATTDM